jgi:multidrug transporter EmrE-like cation transporter
VTAVIGIAYFHDTINWIKILALSVIIFGCVVLQYADELK